MAEKLDAFTFAGAGRRSSFYPWSTWFDGNIWKLKQGTDFGPNPGSFRVTIKSAAKREGKRVKVQAGDTWIVLQVEEDS